MFTPRFGARSHVVSLSLRCHWRPVAVDGRCTVTYFRNIPRNRNDSESYALRRTNHDVSTSPLLIDETVGTALSVRNPETVRR